MKQFSLLTAGLVVAGILLAIVFRSPQPENSTLHVVSQGPTVERLARLTHLVTARVYIADVLTADGEGCRGAWLIKGDALIGVNLREAQITEKDFQNRRATVCLPPPEVMQSRVDHERTRTWEVQKTTWVPWRGDPDSLRDSVMRHAQRLVAAAAGSRDNIVQARSAAEAILRGFFEELGWQVRVVWRDHGSSPPKDSSSVSRATVRPAPFPDPVAPSPQRHEVAHPSPRVTIRRGFITNG